MRDFHIGDRVTFLGRGFLVRGVSPMSVLRRTLHLEDEQTGERVEVTVEELTGNAAQPDTASTDGSDAQSSP
jgi:hypothetical protein